MKLVCLDAGRLLAQRKRGLSAAEGLRLEEHLATCADCQADANLLVGLSGLASAAHVGLSPCARERAIANALAQNARPEAPRAVQPRRVGVLLLGAAASLALAFLALQRPGERAERVLFGQVEVAGSARSAGDVLSSQVQLHAREAAVVALAHARVELRPGSDARWDGGARKLDLQRGSALFEVDPAQQQSFTVQTKAFTVLVLGTRFEVTQRAVVVLSGRVSVQPTAAGPNAPPVVLAAGSEHTRYEVADATTAPVQPQPPAAEPAPQPSAASEAQPPARTTAAARQADKRPDANTLLERARSELAARDATRARATLKLAKPLLHDAAQRAQALSLEAECELQARRFAAARDTYLQVARTFPGMPAAETALFAAARIEAEHGDAKRAAELLGNYLAKHPQGSYVREAERRLQRLTPSTAP